MGLPQITRTKKRITVTEAPLPRATAEGSQDDVRTGPDKPRYPNGLTPTKSKA